MAVATGSSEAGRSEETIASPGRRERSEKTRVKGWPRVTGADAVALWFPDRYGLLHLLEGGFAEEAIVADAL